MEEFYGNGKLLISGEYYLLDGSWGLALPTKYGQRMEVKELDAPLLLWKSYNEDGSLWYQHDFKLKRGKLHTHGKDSITKQLMKFMAAAHRLNPEFLRKAEGYEVKTYLEFPKEWGLGSSSTLIYMLSQWAGVDAFELKNEAFIGSGYDLAIAEMEKPLLYRLNGEVPEYKEVSLSWDFTNKLYFLHLNKKIDSAQEIAEYGHKLISNTDLERVSRISQLLPAVTAVEEFIKLLEEHETILSNTLEVPTQKKQLFPDFNGSIKSLGAWGGDFVLVVSSENPADYFKEKGYPTLIPFQDMIK